jgi:hypothetical protein
MFAGSGMRFRSLWTPERINTALWLDAADSSTIIVEGGGVSEWRDKSGNDRHFLQPAISLRPNYLENAIVSSGASLLEVNPVIPLLSICVVLDISTYKDFGVAISRINNEGGLHSSGTGVYYFNGVLSNPISNLRYINGNTSYTFPAHSINFPSVVKPLGMTLYTLTFSSMYPIKSILNLPTSGQGLIGSFYELVGCPSDILSERQKVEGYLAHKWGLKANLPTNHPFKNYPPRGL